MKIRKIYLLRSLARNSSEESGKKREATLMKTEADNSAATSTKSTCHYRVSKSTRVKLRVSKDSKEDVSSNITKYKKIGNTKSTIQKIRNVLW